MDDQYAGREIVSPADRLNLESTVSMRCIARLLLKWHAEAKRYQSNADRIDNRDLHAECERTGMNLCISRTYAMMDDLAIATGFPGPWQHDPSIDPSRAESSGVGYQGELVS